MEPGDKQKPEKRKKGRRRKRGGSLPGRFREAWAWYRKDLKSAPENQPDPEDQRKTMAIVGIVFLVGLSLFAVIRGGSILSMALPLAMAGLIFVQARLGKATASSGQYRRAEDWMQAVVLLLILILFGSDFLSKHL